MLVQVHDAYRTCCTMTCLCDVSWSMLYSRMCESGVAGSSPAWLGTQVASAGLQK